jgi:hypothetical protein
MPPGLNVAGVCLNHFCLNRCLWRQKNIHQPRALRNRSAAVAQSPMVFHASTCRTRVGPMHALEIQFRPSVVITDIVEKHPEVVEYFNEVNA